MKKQFFALIAVTALSVAPAFAHHSFAMFDGKKLMVLRGTLVTFTYLNPHAWISIMGTVDKQGPVQRWDIQATSPQTLRFVGLKADTLKPGDKVTVAIHPLHDGRNGGSFIFLVTPDGLAHGSNPSEWGLDLASLKPQ